MCKIEHFFVTTLFKKTDFLSYLAPLNVNYYFYFITLHFYIFMKKFYWILSRFAMIVSLVAMVACVDNNQTDNGEGDEPEPTPTPTPTLEFKLEAELVKTGTSTAEIKLTTLNMAQYAYVFDAVKDASAAVEAPSADIIFATGLSSSCEDGETTFTVESLSPATTYNVFIAGATVEDDFYEKVAAVTLTTGSFTDELTIFDIDYAQFSAHFNYPADKIQPGNVIKWGLTEFPQYYQNNTALSDADMINLNDGTYHNYISESTTWNFTEKNSIVGDPTTSDITYYSPIVPGQPMYFMLGEFTWDTNNHWGWGDGYYADLFDEVNYWKDFAVSGYTKLPDQSNYWSGYYRREFVESKAPSKMSAKPTVTMDLTPRGGTIHIKPTEGIFGFCYAIISPDLHMQIMPLLENKPNYMQWYITSFHAFMNSVSMTGYGDTDIILEDLFYDGMKQGVEYTLHITALGNEIGSKQSYSTYKFTLPKPTKPAATIEVKGIDNPEGENVWNQAWFNIKCTSGDAIQIKYIANYEREWMAMFNNYTNAGYTEEEAMDMVIGQYGAPFTAEELAAINTTGYNLRFDSRADANNILGVRVMNDEGLISFAKGSVRTVKEPADPPVQSSLFEELKGEWTATTTIHYDHYHFCEKPGDPNHDCGNTTDDENNYIVSSDEVISSKVVIGDIGYEATLPEEVYQLFFDSSSLKTKAEVDAVYEQFKTTVDDFNTATRGQNRILCQGFELEYDADKITCKVPEHNDKPDGKVPTKFASPYDLFIADADTYSAYNYESPVFDFGPKWYLEIAADGSVSVPFNTYYMAPMSQWLDYVYQLVGVSNNASLPYRRNEDGDIIDGHFPVTISADKNTITINPVKHTYQKTNDNGTKSEVTEDFYPNIARDYNGQYQLYSRIIAPIVLTRNNGSKSTAAAATAAPAVAKQKKNITSLYEVKSATAPKSRTALPATEEVVRPQQVKYAPLSVEQFKANLEKNNARYNRN